MPEKRWFEHPSVNYTIFSKYPALPIAIFPLDYFMLFYVILYKIIYK